MTGEVSEHMRLSLTVWMTGALLSAVVGVAVFSLFVFNDYTGKYSDAMVQSTTSSIYELSRIQSVTCPQAYSALSASIDEVAAVTYQRSNGTTTVLYQYNDASKDNLISLMTGSMTIKNVRVSIETKPATGHLLHIKLEEVDR